MNWVVQMQHKRKTTQNLKHDQPRHETREACKSENPLPGFKLGGSRDNTCELENRVSHTKLFPSAHHSLGLPRQTKGLAFWVNRPCALCVENGTLRVLTSKTWGSRIRRLQAWFWNAFWMREANKFQTHVPLVVGSIMFLWLLCAHLSPSQGRATISTLQRPTHQCPHQVIYFLFCHFYPSCCIRTLSWTGRSIIEPLRKISSSRIKNQGKIIIRKRRLT